MRYLAGRRVEFFFVETVLFLLLLFALSHLAPISFETKVFATFLFLFAWTVNQRAAINKLEYYSHSIVVMLVLSLGLFFLALVAPSSLSMLKIALFLPISWLLLVLVFRYFCSKAVKPYCILAHQRFSKKLSINPKVSYLFKENVLPTDFRHIDAIVVDPHFSYDETWNNLILHARQLDIRIIDIAKYEEYVDNRLSLEQLQENWLVAGFSFSFAYCFFRRTIEVLVILLFSPVLILLCGFLSLGVLVTMGRPILYSQPRVGVDNKPFKLYKFRSMITDSEAQGRKFAASDDPRITPFGAFIRKYRLDELPQFLNVLKGDMSIIGPRPEQAVFVEQFMQEIPLYRLRHIVKPGITGWAQVKQGYADDEDSTRLKLQHDLYYVKHFSFIMDLKVVLKTIQIILTGFGAR